MGSMGFEGFRRSTRGITAKKRPPRLPRADARWLPALRNPARGPDEGAWYDAVELIRVSEWVAAREIALGGEYELALTPEALEIVEGVPYADIGHDSAAERLARLVRFVERLLGLSLPVCGGKLPRTFEFAAPLTTPFRIGPVRLRAHVDQVRRRVTLSTTRSEPPIDG